MSVERARPWWASSDPGVAELDDREDPIWAVRAARLGQEAADGQRPVDDEAADGEAAARQEVSDAAAGHAGEVCGTCPWCIGVRMLTEAKPEVAAHLAEAGRHLAAAVRQLLDERPERSGRTEPDDPVDRCSGRDRSAHSRRDAPFERVHIEDVAEEAGTADTRFS